MTPEQRIMREIILEAMGQGFSHEDHVTEKNVAETFDRLMDDPNEDWSDLVNEFRCGQVETGLQSPSSRNYESKSVAAKLRDGSWVGWTYWYGGGKHGEPESIDWMSDAYELKVTEEQKMVTVLTFSRVGG